MNVECNNCHWTGKEDNLVTKTKLKNDVEYIYCPDCGSDNIKDIKS